MSNDNGNTQTVLTVTLGQEQYALDIYAVREILDMAEVTRIPKMPAYMRGMVNVRGTAVPVVDLKMKFGMEPIEQTLNTRIVILEIEKDGKVTPMGAMTDSVRDVLVLHEEQIDPPPELGSSVDIDFIKGIARKDDAFIILLDVDKVFAREEITMLRQVREEQENTNKTAA
ncbi:chemotaxis protein CheW [Oceanidesulfovibrio marinus]|uniref:Chemotaxis protein CheW n=1 Tax=Oceanidesulfovibrio marinus TaxID=370038 RepID=A0ABX6NIS2_9BACT|nr:chemotaxis protein CheW [Oceanidesulfovibrio marinus]QJT09535.1 chemotaxis protein CheW [Oceanidesulfovibrio marinus]